MSERTSYEPGVPSWVDLSSPDTDASATFYGGLFGWELQSAGPVEETGGYGMFTLRGKQVAGVGPIMQEGQPPVWSVYVATDDANAAAERAARAGASVLVDASATESHIDPLTAAPERNRFLQTVVPFLRKLRASAP